MTRILGTLLTGATLSIVLAAQEPAGKEDIDKLGKEAVRISNAIADALEELAKNPDLKTIEATQEKIKKLQAESKVIGKKMDALPPDSQKILEAKYKKDIESALERTKKAGEKLGVKDVPIAPIGGGGKGEATEQIVKRLHENLDKAVDRLNKDDPGKDTVKIQDDIVKDLDELIKQKQNQDSQSSSSSSSSSASGDPSGSPSGGKSSQRKSSSRISKRPQGSKPQGGKPQGGDKKELAKKEEKKEDKLGGGKDKKDGKDGSGFAGKKKDSKNTIADLERYKEIWGHLPQTKRQEMEAYSKERFMPRYEDLLRQYYRTIAEQGRRD